MKIPEDEFVRELLPEFVDTWLDDLQSKFPVYINEKNSEDLYRLAHTLKGSCFQFGLDEPAQLGIQLMQYAKEHDWEKAESMYSIILKEFTDAKQFVIDNGLS